MPLVSGGGSLYSEEITPSLYGNLDAYLMIFEKNNYELLHSTYFGGSNGNTSTFSEAIREVVVNDFNELFGFGNTQSRYYEDENGIDFGIPISNNTVTGAYFQDNLNNEWGLNNPDSDGFGFKLCLEDTPLSYKRAITYSHSDLLKVYPNPIRASSSHAIVHASFPSPIENLSVFDMTGKKVMQLNKPNRNNFGAFSFRITNAESGVYIIQVETTQGTSQQKLVIYE